jgi:hypothetical protein
MKNSVADRQNAQSSCAGQFIGNHLEVRLRTSLSSILSSVFYTCDKLFGHGIGFLILFLVYLSNCIGVSRDRRQMAAHRYGWAGG